MLRGDWPSFLAWLLVYSPKQYSWPDYRAPLHHHCVSAVFSASTVAFQSFICTSEHRKIRKLC